MGGSIVNDEDIELREILFRQRIQALFKLQRPIARAHDNGDAGTNFSSGHCAKFRFYPADTLIKSYMGVNVYQDGSADR